MKVLVTGASGFIASHLIPRLEKAGHEVTAMTRKKADLLKVETLNNLPTDIDAAYYFVHSMKTRTHNFVDLDRSAAQNFTTYLKKTSCKQIIYLTGILNNGKLSKHLSSRYEVEEIIKRSSIPYTILRSSIILGKGSASFQIIRDLVVRLPIMITPHWLRQSCQPLALEDALDILMTVLGHPKCINEVFDIGGPDILTYKKLLLLYAKVRGLKKRIIITTPLLTPRLSAYWLVLITRVNYNLARSLIESVTNSAVCQNFRFQELFPKDYISCEKGFQNVYD